VPAKIAADLDFVSVHHAGMAGVVREEDEGDESAGETKMKVVLETERLLLRHFTEADAESLLLMEMEPDVLRYVGRKPLADVDAYRNKIRSTFLTYYEKPGGYGAWAVVEKASGEFVGGCTLRPALDSNHAAEMGCTSDDVELGYGLRKPSWGKGYATEVAQALVRRAFTELGAISLVACVTIDNLASVRVLEKAGLRRAGDPLCLPGENELSVKYLLTKVQFDQRWWEP
jgi:RimJ/RimL family protein N-acetyltransferase